MSKTLTAGYLTETETREMALLCGSTADCVAFYQAVTDANEQGIFDYANGLHEHTYKLLEFLCVRIRMQMVADTLRS